MIWTSHKKIENKKDRSNKLPSIFIWTGPYQVIGMHVYLPGILRCLWLAPNMSYHKSSVHSTLLRNQNAHHVGPIIGFRLVFKKNLSIITRYMRVLKCLSPKLKIIFKLDKKWYEICRTNRLSTIWHLTKCSYLDYYRSYIHFQIRILFDNLNLFS